MVTIKWNSISDILPENTLEIKEEKSAEGFTKYFVGPILCWDGRSRTGVCFKRRKLENNNWSNGGLNIVYWAEAPKGFKFPYIFDVNDIEKYRSK